MTPALPLSAGSKFCPCGAISSVVRTRTDDDGNIVRTRTCPTCNRGYTTVETVLRRDPKRKERS